MDPDVKDMKVCVISIAGAMRGGKSFLMNFLLRYLSLSPPGNGDWMQPDERGFKSGAGPELITEGILLWSKPFILRDKQGEKVAVFLMDTQGLYDDESTVKNWTTIFALSTLLSSVTVYNVSQVIDENDLQQMQLFTECAKLVMDKHGGETPFQRLMFLVRDWQNRSEHEFGLEGGRNYLDEVLTIGGNQAVELQKVREHIRASFEQIECFLMPHPGSIVATGQFTGDLAQIDYQFNQQLRVLMPHLCSEIKPNRVNGESITCAQLFHYFKAYSAMLEGDELPEPKSLVQMLAESRNIEAANKARDLYVSKMRELCGGDYVPDLQAKHERLKRNAIAHFDGIKVGGPELSGEYRVYLKREIEEEYKKFEKSNDAKKSNPLAAVAAAMVSVAKAVAAMKRLA